MAQKADNFPNIVDVTKRMAPDGMIARVAEYLTQRNAVNREMTVFQCNKLDKEEVTIRTKLPSVAFKFLNYGTEATDSETRQLVFGTGLLESLSETAKQVADLGGQGPAFIRTEEKAHLDGMNNKMASTIFYGSIGADPASFLGLSQYYNSLTDVHKDYLLDAGGTGTDLRSIWLVGWGQDQIYGVYPKGYMAGLNVIDKGIQMSMTAPVRGSTARTGRMEVYMKMFQWALGVVVHDYRYAVRICNIDMATLTKDASAGADLVTLLTRALNRIYSLPSSNAAFYAPRRVMEELDVQMVNKVGGSTLHMEQIYGDGIWTMMVRGIPIHITDALDTVESRVT